MTAARPTTVKDRHGHARASAAGVRVGGRHLVVSTVLLVVVALLCVIGLVVVGTASSVVSISTYGTPWAILIREIMWMAIGVVALGLAMRVDYRKLRRFSPLLLLVTFGLLFVVLVPGLGVHAMGSSRWVGFGQFRLQPSELMKLALALFAADFISRRLDEDATDRRIIGPLILVTGFACVLILAQPDMGTAMVLGFIALALLFVSGVRLGPVMKVMAALAGLALIVAVASPYRRARLLSFMDPSAHSSGSGYQVMQSLIGLGSGHIYGEGLGGGQAQWGFLPNAHTDFIFSVIGEELGIIGALVVLALLGALLWLGIRAATQAPDRFGALLALGLVAWVGAETLINVGAVVGVLPVTGIPLPFISFGGSSLVITMAAAGVLINVARQGEAGARSGSPGRMAPGRRAAAAPGTGRTASTGFTAGIEAPWRRRPAGRPAPEVGERTARHGDRGRRDGRSHRPLTADRPRAAWSAGTRPTPSSSTGRGGGRRPPRGLRSNSPTRCCPDAGCGGACALRPGGPTPVPWWGSCGPSPARWAPSSPGGRGWSSSWGATRAFPPVSQRSSPGSRSSP